MDNKILQDFMVDELLISYTKGGQDAIKSLVQTIEMVHKNDEYISVEYLLDFLRNTNLGQVRKQVDG